MPRRRHADPSVRIEISLPKSLVLELDLLLFDPVRGRMLYGGRSRLVSALLREWVNKQRSRPAKDVEKDLQKLEYTPDGKPATVGLDS